MPDVKEVCCISLAFSNPFSNTTVAVRYKYSNSDTGTRQEREAVFCTLQFHCLATTCLVGLIEKKQKVKRKQKTVE